MVVVFDFRALGHVVTEFAEDVDYLLTDDADGVAGTQLIRVAGHAEVETRAIGGALVGCAVLELVYLGLNFLLQLVEGLAELGLLGLVYGTEFLEEGRHLALLAEEAHARLFHFLLSLALKLFELLKNPVNIFPFHFFPDLLFFLAARLSRAFLSRAAPSFSYWAHCFSSSTLCID